MKCFTWQNGVLSEGLYVSEDKNLGKIVYLGEEGRGRRFEKICMLRNSPAEVENGKVLDAHPVQIYIGKGTDKEKKFFVLAKPKGEDEKSRILVRVNTRYKYTRNSRGIWVIKNGNPETLVKGWGAHGDAGSVGSWDDGLIIMSPGDVIKIMPEGGYKSSLYVLFYEENMPGTMLLSDYEAKNANQNNESDFGYTDWI